MSIQFKRRALLLGTWLSPAAWAGARLAPIPQERPVDLIRRLMDEVLTSPEQRVAELRMHQRNN
jgi:hypothetical protein